MSSTNKPIFRNPKMQIKVYDYVQNILIKREKLMIVMLIIGIIVGIIVIPFVAKLNPIRSQTKTIRIIMCILGLLSSSLALTLIIVGVFMATK